MRLRAAIDRKLAIGGDEVELSEGARRAVFRGSYILPARVTAVEAESNWDSASRDAYPFHIRITRTNSGGFKSFSGTNRDSQVYKDPHERVRELQDPRALNRATHVERVARRIKATTMLLTFIAGGTALGLAKAGTFSSPATQPLPAAHAAPNPHTVPCISVIDGQEVLVPIAGDEVPIAQRLGAAVCSIGTFDYQVAG